MPQKRSERACRVSNAEAAPRIRFTATVLGPDRVAHPRPTRSAFLQLPEEASAALPSRGMVSVEGTLNGARFIATLEPDGRGGHRLLIDRKMQKTVGPSVALEPGRTVTLDIAPVAPADEPEPSVPSDLRTALSAASAGTRQAWSSITAIARRDFIQWITSAKRDDTRARRIVAACDMLAKGKRRPCCFDRSGMYGTGRSGRASRGRADT